MLVMFAAGVAALGLGSILLLSVADRLVGTRRPLA
jgi:hypothetical protein